MTTLSAIGLQTLATLTAAGDHYLTQEQGNELANHGLINVDATQPSPTNALAFKCSLTPAGMQLATAPAPMPAPVAPAAPVAPVAPLAPTEAPSFQIDSGIALPTIKRFGGKERASRAPKYPFDLLEVGQSFHVPATPETIEKVSRAMSTAVSNANGDSKVEVQPQELELVTKFRYTKDEAGNFIKGENGKKVRESYQEQEAKTAQTKFFCARKVTAAGGDPAGDGVRIFRVAE